MKLHTKSKLWLQILFGTTIAIGSIAAITFATVSCSSTPNNEPPVKDEYTLVDQMGLSKLLDLPVDAVPDNFNKPDISFNDKAFITPNADYSNIPAEDMLLMKNFVDINTATITGGNPDRLLLINKYNDLSKKIKYKFIFSKYNKAAIMYHFLKDDYDNSVSGKNVTYMMAKIAQI